MNKNKNIKDASKGQSSLMVQMRRIHKKLSGSGSKIEELVSGLDKKGNDEKKESVKAISTTLFDLRELIHDLNLFVDELFGDDLVQVDEGALEAISDQVEIVPAIVDKFENHLKNYFKTCYDDSINEDIRLISYNDFEHGWRSLKKNLDRIIGYLETLIETFTEI